MDSNHQEVDLAEEDNSLGIGRSYECVFCKRGFNTAQALGGHMNIHRKDRARNKPAKHEESHTVPRSYHQIPSYQTHYVASHEAQLNCNRSYFPASSSPAQPFIFANHHYINVNDFNPPRVNPFGVDDWSMSFGLPCGSSAHVEDNRRVGGGQEEELDLELRLGP